MPDLPRHGEGVCVPGALWAQLVCHLPVTPLCFPLAGKPHLTMSGLHLLSDAFVRCDRSFRQHAQHEGPPHPVKYGFGQSLSPVKESEFLVLNLEQPRGRGHSS